jgi:hypothetical protein
MCQVYLPDIVSEKLNIHIERLQKKFPEADITSSILVSGALNAIMTLSDKETIKLINTYSIRKASGKVRSFDVLRKELKI